MTDYPESEKLSKLAIERSAISEFLEWLNSKGYIIGEYKEGFFSGERLNPVSSTHDDLTMEYLEIDTTVLEQERRAMLIELTRKT